MSEGGSGLGLALSRKTVLSHGGDLRAIHDAAEFDLNIAIRKRPHIVEQPRADRRWVGSTNSACLPRRVIWRTLGLLPQPIRFNSYVVPSIVLAVYVPSVGRVVPNQERRSGDDTSRSQKS
jgi:hypothetical protein